MRTISRAAAALVALVALASMPAHLARADEAPAPSLPKGWRTGGAGLEKLPPLVKHEFGSHQTNHEFTFRARPPVPGERVDVTSLPVVEIEKSTLPAAPPRELPQGSPGDIVVLKKGKAPRVSVQGFEAGFIQVGNALPTAVGRQSEGGAVGVCGPAAKEQGTLPISYEVLRRVDTKGSVELVWARGLLDAATCRAVILERHAGRPQHVAGGVVYAFRTRCAACDEGARDLLHVLTPQGDRQFEKVVPFEHHTLVLAPGKSAAFEAGTSFKSPLGGTYWGMPDWQNVIDRKCKTDAVWCFKRVRMDVSQGRGEPTPVVFVGGDLD